jgi:hypothetical protein
MGNSEAAQTSDLEAMMATAGSTSRDPTMGMGRGRVSGGGFLGQWAAPPRTAYTSETKPFFLTSEFLVYVLFLMGLGIGTATSDDVDPRLFWILATIATAAYMLSRGIAKAASRSRAYDPREDVDIGRDDR